MITFNSLDDIINIDDTAVALGNFDGVHLGHQQLIKEMTAFFDLSDSVHVSS